MKKVYKYGTGQKIPEGAIYLSTIKQTEIQDPVDRVWYQCWLVWHYFLVEVPTPSIGQGEEGR